VQLLHESSKAGTRKFVAIGTVCAYPKFTLVPLKESDFWVGFPDETNASYRLTQKMLLMQSMAHRRH
jgi:GDP-L-fucose synthase